MSRLCSRLDLTIPALIPNTNTSIVGGKKKPINKFHSQVLHFRYPSLKKRFSQDDSGCCDRLGARLQPQPGRQPQLAGLGGPLVVAMQGAALGSSAPGHPQQSCAPRGSRLEAKKGIQAQLNKKKLNNAVSTRH